MAYLSLSLLGPFQAWTANGSPQPFRTLKERALLAYLVVEHNQPHRREKLAELFWPDRPEGIARNNLRQALFGIRQVIGEAGFEAAFTATNDEIRANLSEDLWLDLAAYGLHLRAFQSHHHPSNTFCPYCIQHLRDAVEIYRGSFLEDVFLDQNRDFEEWAAVQRQKHFRLQTQALDFLIQAYEKIGEYGQAAFYAVRQVALDDLKESQYRRLMMLLAKTGQNGAALEQYEILRRKLDETLSTEPDDKTAALAEQIREGSFEAGASPALDVDHNLPEYLTPFIGREMELMQIAQALENPANRLVSLVGPGGVGKTRLAIQAAQLNLRLFTDGVYFVPLDTIQSAGQLVEAIARAVGVVSGGQQEIRVTLTDYLRQRHVLIVVDNFEHLVDGKDLLLDLLHSAPFVKILLTSRERLSLQAEYLIELRGLPFPTPAPDQESELEVQGQVNPLNPVHMSDAVHLLYERANRVRSIFPVDIPGPAVRLDENPGLQGPENSQELRDAVRICQLVDGLPLGIELAASWARDYTFAQIAEEVQRNMEFLETSYQDVPERHRSLRASFEHSWDLLSESEREVFCKLAVFPGSFSVKAAQEIAGAALPWLVRLEDKSLVRRAGFGRYDLHPLLRQYAGQKLRQFSRRVEDAARQQHARFFCAFLHERAVDLKGRRQADALREVETDLENIFSAWDWAVEHHAHDLINQAAFGMWFTLEALSRWKEGEERFHSALNSLQNFGSDPYDKRFLAYLMTGQGWFCCRLSRFQQAEELIQSSLQTLNDQEASFERVFAHFALGFLYTWIGRFKEAWLHLLGSLSAAEQIGEEWEMSWSRELLAEIAFESGQTGYDEKPFLTTLSLFERLGEQRGSCRALNYLGIIAMSQGRYPEARAYYEKLLTNVEKLGDVWGAAGGYSKLGQLAAARGEYERAWRFHRRSLALLHRTEDQRRTAYTLRELGEAAAALSRWSETVDYFYQALEIAARIRYTPLAQDILVGVASVLFQRSKKADALELLDLVFTEPIGDQLLASRAAHLRESINASFSAEQIEQIRIQSQLKTVWDAVEALLRTGVQL